MWETTKEDALVAGTKINCPTGAGPAPQALGSAAGQRAADTPGPFASALSAQRQVPAPPGRPQARLLAAEPPAPADLCTNSGRTFHEHISEDSSCDAKDPHRK